MKPAAVIGTSMLVSALSGCVYANGFYETFDTRVEPAAMVTPASAARAEPPPSATEIRYVHDTARVVFRRRPAERTPDFVAQGPDGYAICLRSGRDYALLVFARRVFEDAISQAADDARILRSSADTAVCRSGSQRWIAT
ncbi:hypothetical protein [Aureimonas leprariae]|uniref:Lipoprotein n=1 Tax=Plantimonas leprariae TaxID=2615207 RepID=A0A7V7TXK4_9HYPH|nr:hypothetical protein [Aureimonas leprariae]KAB0680878.1 hypothetical protein F6X38_07795 [Aureimonas leprariae]